MAPWLSFSAALGLAMLPAALFSMVLGTMLVEYWLDGGSTNPLLAPSTLDTLQDCLGGGAVASIFLTLLVGPVVHAGLTARFLTSIRKARALEEVVATPLTPRRVVDALAVHGVRQTLRTLVLPLAFCTGLFWLSGWPVEALVFACLPACWALYWFFSLLAAKAWDGEAQHSEPGLAMALARLTGILGPLAVMAWLGVQVAWDVGPIPGAALVALTSVLWALFHREMAVKGLDCDSGLRRILRRWSTAASRRPRSFQASALNALLFREQASRSGTLQQRFLGFCVWAVPVLALFGAVWAGPEPTLVFLAMLWPLLGLLAVLRVLQVSSVRLHEERQQGSLDLLLQTGLTVQEFVEGCVGVAAGRGRRVLFPLVLATAAALLPGIVQGELTWWPLVWMALAVFLSVEAAAAWGTSMSADCRHRPQPAGVVVTFLTAAGIGWGLASTAGFLLFMPVAVAAVPGDVLWPLQGELVAILVLSALPIGLLLVRQVALVSARNTLLQKGRTIGFVDRMPQCTQRGADAAETGLEVAPCWSAPVSGGSR